MEKRSLQLVTQPKQLRKESLKKIQALNESLNFFKAFFSQLFKLRKITAKIFLLVNKYSSKHKLCKYSKIMK